jgi:hypothetical protein
VGNDGWLFGIEEKRMMTVSAIHLRDEKSDRLALTKIAVGGFLKVCLDLLRKRLHIAIGNALLPDEGRGALRRLVRVEAAIALRQLLLEERAVIPKMSAAEKVVGGLAGLVLAAGFAAGVLGKSPTAGVNGSLLTTEALMLGTHVAGRGTPAFVVVEQESRNEAARGSGTCVVRVSAMKSPTCSPANRGDLQLRAEIR